MSRLAKKPVIVPAGVTLTQGDEQFSFKGPKGELIVPLLPLIKISVSGNEITVAASNTTKQSRSNVGTMWSLFRNAAEGVDKGYIKSLEIQGVGYRAMLDGKTLVLNLGFVNPVKFVPDAGVNVEVEKNIIRISGASKEKVGAAAAKIRSFKKPEPYKGKGIRYVGEVVTLKAGKKAASGGK